MAGCNCALSKSFSSPTTSTDVIVKFSGFLSHWCPPITPNKGMPIKATKPNVFHGSERPVLNERFVALAFLRVACGRFAFFLLNNITRLRFY